MSPIIHARGRILNGVAYKTAERRKQIDQRVKPVLDARRPAWKQRLTFGVISHRSIVNQKGTKAFRRARSGPARKVLGNSTRVRRAMKKSVRINVNGTTRESEVEPRLLLVHYLRDSLGLTGTHVGCETSLCGACTVMVNGQAVKARTMFAVQADGFDVTTI